MPGEPKPVLVIGSLNMDLVARCERLPERGQTIMGRDFFTAPGGKGANQAVAAARLGARVSMAGCVGRDAFGEALVAGLRDAAIRTDDVVPVDGPTGTALITIDAAGGNTIVVISGANLACDAALVDRALAGAGGPGILLLQHEIPAEANARAIRAARQAGWFVMLNPAPARPVPAELLSWSISSRRTKPKPQRSPAAPSPAAVMRWPPPGACWRWVRRLLSSHWAARAQSTAMHRALGIVRP